MVRLWTYDKTTVDLSQLVAFSHANLPVWGDTLHLFLRGYNEPVRIFIRDKDLVAEVARDIEVIWKQSQ